MFVPQAQDLLEKLAEILFYNFHREHILLKLEIKKLLRKIKSKNLTARVFFFFLVPINEPAYETLGTNNMHRLCKWRRLRRTHSQHVYSF